MRVPALACAVLALAACKRTPAGEASCDQAGQHVHALALARVGASAAVTAADRPQVTGLLAPMRDALVRHCREQAWAAPVRACITAAADLHGVTACQAQLSPEHRAQLAAHARGQKD